MNIIPFSQNESKICSGMSPKCSTIISGEKSSQIIFGKASKMWHAHTVSQYFHFKTFFERN